MGRAKATAWAGCTNSRSGPRTSPKFDLFVLNCVKNDSSRGQ